MSPEKKAASRRMATIEVKLQTKRRLDKERSKGETYDDVIQRLLELARKTKKRSEGQPWVTGRPIPEAPQIPSRPRGEVPPMPPEHVPPPPNRMGR